MISIKALGVLAPLLAATPAMAGPLVVGYVLAATTLSSATGTTKNWELVFAISSVIYFLGALFWLFIDPVTPLEEGPKQSDRESKEVA